MKKLKVFIVDDHKLIREMWRMIFEEKEHLEVVGESGQLNDALEQIYKLRPDVVLLDINLPPDSGMDAVPHIRKHVPGAKIIAVSMHNQPAYAKKMFQLGVKGYVTKNSSQSELLKAIEEVIAGNNYICTEIKDKLSDIVLQEDAQSGVKDLSIRELEVIKLIKEGLSSKEIAAKLDISVRTAEVHRHNILKKLKLKNSAALINFANNTLII